MRQTKSLLRYAFRETRCTRCAGRGWLTSHGPPGNTPMGIEACITCGGWRYVFQGARGIFAIIKAFRFEKWRRSLPVNQGTDPRQPAEAPGHRLPPENDPRNWPEDFPHENGNYLNKCMHCEGPFWGHKRRVVCKVCDAIRGPLTLPETAPEEWRIDARNIIHAEDIGDPLRCSDPILFALLDRLYAALRAALAEGDRHGG